MFAFGPGVLIATLAGGTPVNIGLAQEITLDEKASNKGLVGQGRRKLAVGGGVITTTIKVKLARISGLALAQLWLGIQPTAGGTFSIIGEAHTLPASSPSLTIAPPNGGTFFQDAGINYSATGVPLINSGTVAPGTGQYSVNPSTGIYSFAVGDDSKGIYANYAYKTGSFGQSIVSTNPQLGNTVSIGALINIIDPTTNLSATLQVFNIVFDNVSLGSKLEDFLYPEMNGEAYCNPAGQCWQWNFPDNF